MNYTVIRSGQTYGPYTLEDLQRYVASGNILPTDMAKSDAMLEAQPVSQILSGAAAPPAFGASGFTQVGQSGNLAGDQSGTQSSSFAPAQGFSPQGPGGFAPQPGMAGMSPAQAASMYPDPPALHWGLVLLFSVLTCNLFADVWDIVQSAWLKRVQPNSTALYVYIGAGVVSLLYLGSSFAQGFASGLNGSTTRPNAMTGISGVLVLVLIVLRIWARFSMKASLEEHFNREEPIGLTLSGVMVFFFSTYYFQYHMTRITDMKKVARMSGPAMYGAGVMGPGPR